LEEQQLRFLEESVDGSPTSLPPVQIYVMGANRWRTENEWPLARTDWQTWYLDGDGSLGREQPDPGTATYVHDPHDPVPTVDVASSSFPCYDRNSGSGTPGGQFTEADFVPATQRLFFGGGRPSAVRLPVIPQDPSVRTTK